MVIKQATKKRLDGKKQIMRVLQYQYARERYKRAMVYHPVHLCGSIAHTTNFSRQILLKPGFVAKTIPTQGVVQYRHRYACVLPTEAPGRHSTQTRTLASHAAG